jgi:hypothetical protein
MSVPSMLYRHPGAGRDAGLRQGSWIPAFAGMRSVTDARPRVGIDANEVQA